MVVHSIKDGLFIVLEAETADAAAIVRYFDTVEEIISHEVLHMDEQTVLIRYEIPEPVPYQAADHRLINRETPLFYEMDDIHRLHHLAKITLAVHRTI